MNQTFSSSKFTPRLSFSPADEFDESFPEQSDSLNHRKFGDDITARINVGRRNSCTALMTRPSLDEGQKNFLAVFYAKIMVFGDVNFMKVLEDIGWFGFWDVGKFVHANLERIWH